MTKSLPDVPVLTLNDGLTLPAVGFGTYKLNGAAGVSTITSAIKHGYRLIDTAFNYENEGAVGQAVKKSSVPREQLRIVSKLPGRHQHFDEAMTTIEESLYRAGLDYYDLYLIHWPNPKQGLYVEAWKAMIEARKRGLVRSIGVCNFLPEHLDRLTKETSVTPSLNQIELHPYFPQAVQREADKARSVLTQGWSPLGRASALLKDAEIQKIATRLGRSIPQVILRWHVQLGVVPVPKATSPERQLENLSLFDFELSADDMKVIAGLARPDGRLAGQDPAEYEEF